MEIIGWLYQFYISEKKGQVIGKVVKSEDIPAATQLFTPNWIVQYLVQNSVGRLWLMANLASTLGSEWPYYIQPAEQTPAVQAQLDALIQTRMDEDGGSLNPETITVLDPACGSGHILVVAYDVLKVIYLERGYQARAIPRLILEKNLYGLDIDDRAAQMAGFALLMKARADDRRLFNEPPKLNVLSLQESKGLDASALAQAINSSGSGRVEVAQLRWLIDTFEHAKTFGSLIQVDPQHTTKLRGLLSTVYQAMQTDDLYAQTAAKDVLPLVQQALVLEMQFDAVVANPPYMGNNGMNSELKKFAKATFRHSKTDLFAMFIDRGLLWCKACGFNGMVTMQSWMFLSSFEEMRRSLLTERTIQTMAHLGAHAFTEIGGEVVQTTAFILQSQHMAGFRPVFFRLVDGLEDKKNTDLLGKNNCFDKTIQDDFKKVPGSPVAYWLTDRARENYSTSTLLGDISQPRQGMATTNNKKYLRLWFEISISNIAFGCESASEGNEEGKNWFPYNKGGEYRKWYGNNEFVIFYEQGGSALIEMVRAKYPKISDPEFVIKNRKYYFKPSVTWSYIGSANLGVRISDSGFIFDVAGSSIFPDVTERYWIAAFMVSRVAGYYLNAINPTLNFQVENISALPILSNALANKKARISQLAASATKIARADWDSDETSWDFQSFPLTTRGQREVSTEASWVAWDELIAHQTSTMKAMEEECNQIFIETYGLESELSPKVPESEITLTRADREKDCQRLISYVIGCMMGRYSLDEPGLIYAHAGNVGFDASRYATFPADADGIVPLTDELWFEGDAASRVREFLLAVWGADTLAENMAWLAESLGTKASETPDETIRRYLADKFFKDHLQTYKKRPIYWLFSSGKQGAFQALVYLHRYTKGTLARLRAEYVVPLTGKIQNRIEMLQKDAAAASSTAARNKLAKEVEKLMKKHVELLAYDEQLRHYADMRINLDLDDGVKVNYGKFGDLLDSVKVVTGGAGDD